MPRVYERLFIAIRPPESALARWCEAAAAIESAIYRRIPLEQVHLTVCFIGDRNASEFESTLQSATRAAAGIERFALQPLEICTWPREHRQSASAKRQLVVVTDLPSALSELVARSTRALCRQSRRDPNRGFTPRFTIAEMARSSVPVDFARELFEPPFPVTQLEVVHTNAVASEIVHHTALTIEL